MFTERKVACYSSDGAIELEPIETWISRNEAEARDAYLKWKAIKQLNAYLPMLPRYVPARGRELIAVLASTAPGACGQVLVKFLSKHWKDSEIPAKIRKLTTRFEVTSYS